ncbi:MAG: hypothetical protein HY242_04325 [Afipia sp.]|nr:hypothetical protein [Afipia sp.]
MTLGTLKTVRFIMPGILYLVFAKLLGVITGLWVTTMPNFAKAQYLPIVVIPAVLYYITPFRRWANARFHNRIIERLRTGLVAISGNSDNEKKYTWVNLRPLFFSLADNDKSLEQKVKLAFSNGAVWTSFADSAVLSILFFLVSIFLYLIGFEDAFLAGLVFAIIFAVSVVGSEVCTRRHIGIGEQQLEIIKLKYKESVQSRLHELD